MLFQPLYYSAQANLPWAASIFDFKYRNSCNFFYLWSSKQGWIWIRIRIETTADPKHWFLFLVNVKSRSRTARYRIKSRIIRIQLICCESTKTRVPVLHNCYVQELGRPISAREAGSNKQSASKSCALSLVRQLYHLGVVEAYTGSLKKNKVLRKGNPFNLKVKAVG